MKWMFMPLCALTAMVLVGGCVTETNSSLRAKYDPDKAVENSVAAAMIHLQEGRVQDAHRNLKRAAEFDANSPKVNNAYALLYGLEGDRKREEEHYKKAIRSDSSYSLARNNYAAFLFSQKRYDEAIDQLLEVVDDVEYEKRHAAFASLGQCYLAQGEREEARDAFFRSVRLLPQYYPSWIQLVGMSVDDKDFRAARSQLTSYEKTGPKTLASLNYGLEISKALGNQAAVADYSRQIEALKAER